MKKHFIIPLTLLLFILMLSSCSFESKTEEIKIEDGSSQPEEDIVPKLMDKFRDKSIPPRQRAKVAIKFMDLKDPRAIPVLIEGLSDTDIEVRYRSILALAEFKDPRAVPELERETRWLDEDPYLRSLALVAMVRCGEVSRSPEILKFLSSNRNEIREETVKTLELLGNPSYIPFLQEVCQKDKETYIREMAQKAIENIQKKNR